MTNTDRETLLFLALGVGLVWVSQLHWGSSLGMPGLTTGSGKPADKREGAPKSPARGKGPTKPAEGVVVDVDSPKVVSMSEWETKRRAARARARLLKQKQQQKPPP
jgi:hypothetical protein